MYNNIYSRFIRSAENTLLDNSSSKERTNVLDTSRRNLWVLFQKKKKGKIHKSNIAESKINRNQQVFDKETFFSINLLCARWLSTVV